MTPTPPSAHPSPSERDAPRPRISLIAAASENDVIGRDGDIPWHVSDDLRRFKRLTSGHPIIMGRKTWESIGRPLPKRTNIVVTRRADYAAEGAVVVDSLEAALAEARAADEEEVFVIGGGEIYRQALPLAHRVHLTRVHVTVDGDAFFPELEPSEWEETAREAHAQDDAERGTLRYTFLVLDRRA